MKLLIALALLAACKKEAPAPVEHVAPTRARPVDAAVAALPSDFPSIGSPALTGELDGMRFVPKKAFLKTRPSGATLEFWAKSSGGPCEPQLALADDDLYISISIPPGLATVGTVISSADAPRITVTYKQRETFKRTKREVVLQLDELAAGRARGRLMFIADNASAKGSFEVVVCTSGQQQLEPPAPIHGLAWQASPKPAELPHQPLSAVLLGKPATPAAVEIVDWSSGKVAQHEIHIYMTPPPSPCDPSQTKPGFSIGVGVPITAGVTASGVSSASSTPFANAIWSEPGNVMGMEASGGVSAIIDGVRGDTVTGRVYAWFSDPSKSMVAGAFTARRCKIDPN